MPLQAVKTKAAVLKVLKALEAIQGWEHWREIQLCAQKEYRIPVEEFYRLLPEYQRFIALTAGYEGIGMVSVEVDKLWHAHILNTKRYYDFCQQYLGRMVHHLPYSSYILYGYNAEEENPKCQLPPPIPECNDIPPTDPLRNFDENPSEIRTTICTATESFYQAYKECYGTAPSSGVWERLAPLVESEGVSI